MIKENILTFTKDINKKLIEINILNKYFKINGYIDSNKIDSYGISYKFVDILGKNSVKFLLLSNNYAKVFSNAISNQIIGLMYGYYIRLRLKGVGYKVRVKRGIKNSVKIIFKVGFRHLIQYNVPNNIVFRAFFKKRRLVVFSYDKVILSDSVLEIQKFRTPDRYEGKGIRLGGRLLRFKAGKQR